MFSLRWDYRLRKDRKEEADFLSEIVLRDLFFYVIFILSGFVSSFGRIFFTLHRAHNKH